MTCDLQIRPAGLEPAHSCGGSNMHYLLVEEMLVELQLQIILILIFKSFMSSTCVINR